MGHIVIHEDLNPESTKELLSTIKTGALPGTQVGGGGAQIFAPNLTSAII